MPFLKPIPSGAFKRSQVFNSQDPKDPAMPFAGFWLHLKTIRYSIPNGGPGVVSHVKIL